MKKIRILAAALIVVLALGFVGCGSSKGSSSYAREEAPAAPEPAPAYGAYATNAAADMAVAEEYDSYAYSEAKDAGTGLSNGDMVVESGDERPMSDKIIYNADVTLETTAFDEALEKIGAMVSQMGGYVESSSVSGSNYNTISRGNAGTRNAYFTIRIPSQHFRSFTGNLTDLGNVPYNRTYSQNVTQAYYDTQSRLEAFQTQEKRLLEMLSIAETVEDMLAIQRELTEVQYELDSLKGTLRYYDNQVNYSTVSLTVNEVREYTPTPTVTLTYWERMSKEFRQSLKNTGHFFTELFLWLVTSLPWLVPLAAVIAALIALLRRKVRRDPEKAQARAARRAENRRIRAERRAARKKKGSDTENK